MKFCNHCGRLYDGDICQCRKKVKREYKNRVSFYDTKGWRAISSYIKVRDYGMDRLKLYFQKYSPTNATEKLLYDFLIDANGIPRDFGGSLMVHHIKELSERWSERFELNNLIALNFHTHEYVHTLYERGQKEAVQELLHKAVMASLP